MVAGEADKVAPRRQQRRQPGLHGPCCACYALKRQRTAGGFGMWRASQTVSMDAFRSEFLFWHALLACRFLGPLPVGKIGPAPLPCHRAWLGPISPDVVKLRGSFRRTPPMNLAPLARGVVRLVRGVHHDPTAARTPIGHVRENLSVIL